MSKGLRHLQAALGVPETGVEGEEEREHVKRGKCVSDNSPKKEPVVSPQVGVIFPGEHSSSVEIFKKTEDNSVNFGGVPARKPDVILPSKVSNVRAACQRGRLVRICSEKKNQPCSWLCRNTKKTRQWS